ncbi:hypothetical protein PVAP13_2NG232906 [Panicum virgatum]|uniref:Uncharacterized protein n=1 Tax=Panicum virgatum TaxID=38727 RepID=A0A8T0VHC2_PANVG|nr:hypothetical protein PVAP13_2NG232906 [Panicum virgatum]
MTIFTQATPSPTADPQWQLIAVLRKKTNSSGAPILAGILHGPPNSTPKPPGIGASYSPSDSWVPPPPPLDPLPFSWASPAPPPTDDVDSSGKADGPAAALVQAPAWPDLPQSGDRIHPFHADRHPTAALAAGSAAFPLWCASRRPPLRTSSRRRCSSRPPSWPERPVPARGEAPTRSARSARACGRAPAGQPGQSRGGSCASAGELEERAAASRGGHRWEMRLLRAAAAATPVCRHRGPSLQRLLLRTAAIERARSAVPLLRASATGQARGAAPTPWPWWGARACSLGLGAAVPHGAAGVASTQQRPCLARRLQPREERERLEPRARSSARRSERERH